MLPKKVLEKAYSAEIVSNQSNQSNPSNEMKCTGNALCRASILIALDQLAKQPMLPGAKTFLRKIISYLMRLTTSDNFIAFKRKMSFSDSPQALKVTYETVFPLKFPPK